MTRCIECDEPTREQYRVIPGGKATVPLCSRCRGRVREFRGNAIRAGLQQAKAQGTRLGRPVVLPPELRQRIKALRESGLSFYRIAQMLAEEEVPTAHGGRWHPTTVKKVMEYDDGS